MSGGGHDVGVGDGVKIAQKGVKYTPFQKLYDCFIGILAGAQGIVEINDRFVHDWNFTASASMRSS